MSLLQQSLKNKFHANKKRFFTEKQLKSEFSDAFIEVLKSGQKKRSFFFRRATLIRNIENSIIVNKMNPRVRIKANKILTNFKEFLEAFEK